MNNQLNLEKFSYAIAYFQMQFDKELGRDYEMYFGSFEEGLEFISDYYDELKTELAIEI